MRLSIQNPLVQTPRPRLIKQQIKILQRLRRPKALHTILPLGRHLRHIVDRRIPIQRPCMRIDGGEHNPAHVSPVLLAGDTVHIEDAFNSFGAEEILFRADFDEAGG